MIRRAHQGAGLIIKRPMASQLGSGLSIAPAISSTDIRPHPSSSGRGPEHRRRTALRTALHAAAAAADVDVAAQLINASSDIIPRPTLIMAIQS